MSEENPAARHGTLRKVLDGIYMVTGAVCIGRPLGLPMVVSRNMFVVQHDDGLVLVHSMRLNPAGLEALEKLGRPAHVIRLAGFHGMDDRFYKETYGAKIWSMKGAPYVKGFNVDPKPEESYFTADAELDEMTELPLGDASIFPFKSSKTGECLLVLERCGGIVFAGDSLQNWATADEHFSFVGRVLMKLLGFVKPHLVGQGWLKMAKPDPAEIQGVLDLDFDNLLPVHGVPVLGGAKEAFRPAISSLQR